MIAGRDPHVAIGGMGGSGTRLIALLARELGVDMGRDLNDALDNLAWTLMFKRSDVLRQDDAQLTADMDIFIAAMSQSRPLNAQERERVRYLAQADRLQHSADWLAERAARLEAAGKDARGKGPWGWKEPNTHLLLPFLVRRFPTLRYIHVVRHGLDMAFSDNQNQLANWGEHFRIEADEPPPLRALRYWITMQRRARKLGELFGSRFLWLDYDQFCADPTPGILRLAQFLSLPAADMDRLVALVRAPSSVGRYRTRDCSLFPASTLEEVRELGFPVEL